MQWQPGYQLKNRPYRIERVLGEGGFGITYKAQHLSFEIPVVIKTPNSRLQRDSNYPKFVEYFKREGKQLAKLGLNRHPHIVRVNDFFQEDNLPCIVMDFIDGKNLHDFFFTMEYCSGGTVSNVMENFGGKLPIKIAIPTILQVLDGLHYAHTEKGLIHRDIKPDNIFINVTEEEDVIVKLGDYGLAKAFDMAGLSGQTMTGSQMGTPVFMPRQQVLNFKYAKPDVDVWAVAASLYNMLTGEYPKDFIGADPWVVILQNSPVPIRHRDASIPKPLAEVIDLALIDNPELHFKSAKDFQNALLKTI